MPTITDSMYSWWVHPLAVETGDVTWIGGVARDGTNRVHRVNNTTGAVDTVNLTGPYEADEHNGVAVGYNPDRSTLLVAHSRHGSDPHVRVQTVHRDTLALGAQQQLDMGAGSVAYAQLLQAGDTVHLLCRRANQRWMYRTSTNWGATWGPPKVLIDAATDELGKVYVVTRPDFTNPDIVHFAVAGHPYLSPFRNVAYGKIKLSTGTVHKRSGNQIGTLAASGGPQIRPSQLDQAITPSSTSVVRTLDVGTVGGQPAIAYAVWNGGSGDNSKYKVKRWTGSETGWDSGSWQLTSGKTFGHSKAAHYHGGMTFGPSGELYTSRHDGSDWVVEQRQWNGSTFEMVAELDRSPIRRIRPYPVRGGSRVMWQQVCLYESFRDYHGDTYLP